MRQRLPNFVTLANLFCGCAAVVNVLNTEFVTAFYFLFIAGFADYVDGLLARALGVNSPIGKELDSLADMVSFGVAPGAMLYTLLCITFDLPTTGGLQWWAAPGFVLTLFACLRLAKFNIDTRQTENFMGLNTPAATIFVTGLMLIYEWDTLGLRSFVLQPWLLYAVTAVLSALLVAEIPMISFKFKSFQWKGNEPRFIFLILTIVLLIAFKELAFSLLILLYILYSLTQHLLIKTR